MRFISFIIILCCTLFIVGEKVTAQECQCAESQKSECHCPTKTIALELIPLEECECNKDQCHQMDSRSLSLEREEELFIELKKPSYFKFGSNSKNDMLETRLILDDHQACFCEFGIFGWLLNWTEDQPPIQLIGVIFGPTSNLYHYQATQTLGNVSLSFISHTIPRYYAGLHLSVKKNIKEK